MDFDTDPNTKLNPYIIIPARDPHQCRESNRIMDFNADHADHADHDDDDDDDDDDDSCC